MSLRTWFRALASVLGASALSACATPVGDRVFGVPRVEWHALEACRAPLEAKLCAGPEAGEACWEEVRASYAALPDTLDRKRFLLDAGCPSPTVEAWLPDPR